MPVYTAINCQIRPLLLVPRVLIMENEPSNTCNIILNGQSLHNHHYDTSVSPDEDIMSMVPDR